MHIAHQHFLEANWEMMKAYIALFISFSTIKLIKSLDVETYGIMVTPVHYIEKAYFTYIGKSLWDIWSSLFSMG